LQHAEAVCNVMPRIKNACLLTGLTALAAMVAGGSAVQAGTITVKGGIQEGSGTGGDPPYVYIFDLYLTSGSIAPDLGAQTSTITINGLVGVSGPGFDTSQILSASSPSEPPSIAASGSLQASEDWITPAGGIVTTPSPLPVGFVANGYNYESSVTWEYSQGPTITYSGSPVFLGEFTVNTSWTYTATQSAPVTPQDTVINYSYSTGSGGGSSTGSLVVQYGDPSVPEPSSLVLILIGGAVLPLAALHRRRLVRSRHIP
jgi:hypothetical protein